MMMKLDNSVTTSFESDARCELVHRIAGICNDQTSSFHSLHLVVEKACNVHFDIDFSFLFWDKVQPSFTCIYLIPADQCKFT